MISKTPSLTITLSKSKFVIGGRDWLDGISFLLACDVEFGLRSALLLFGVFSPRGGVDSFCVTSLFSIVEVSELLLLVLTGFVSSGSGSLVTATGSFAVEVLVLRLGLSSEV